MTSNELLKIITKSRERQDKLLEQKGADYTRHSPDRLSNFKRGAEAVGVSNETVWAIYAGKHWDAVMAFIKTGKVESEAIEGRLDDLHNYLYLLEGLIEERKKGGLLGLGLPPQLLADSLR